ncbi:hypothetical protein diail_2065 [Diaporthe ilicicola]|nr:hypothetical protein diail_2065 [Diaporthe ilicicola]
MSSPIDCSSTGASSVASSPTSDGLGARRPAASPTAQEIHGHDGLEGESHGDDSQMHIKTENSDNGSHDSEEFDRKDHGSEKMDEEDIGTDDTENNLTDEGEMDRRDVDGEDIENEDMSHEGIGRALLPRDQNPRRGPQLRLLALILSLFVLAAVIYSVRDLLPAYLPGPPQMPAWLANLELALPVPLVHLDGAGSVRKIVEAYKPFMGEDIGLLAARSWPSSGAPAAMNRAIPGADFESLGGTLAFFDRLSRNVTEYCATVEHLYSTPAGETQRSHEQEIKGLCGPLATLSRSASATYIEVAYGLAGPHRGTRWLEQVRTELLDLAHAAVAPAGETGPGHTIADQADHLTANASTGERLRRHIGPHGTWQATNSRFRGALVGLHRSCRAVEEAWVPLAPLGRSFIAGTRASAAHDAAIGSFHAQVASDWLLLETAMAVVKDLRLAAEEGIKALAMAQFRLQELHDKLGCVKRACWMASQAGDGRKVKVRLTLADPSVLRDMLVRTAEWLAAQTADLHDGDN